MSPHAHKTWHNNTIDTQFILHTNLASTQFSPSVVSFHTVYRWPYCTIIVTVIIWCFVKLFSFRYLKKIFKKTVSNKRLKNDMRLKKKRVPRKKLDSPFSLCFSEIYDFFCSCFGKFPQSWRKRNYKFLENHYFFTKTLRPLHYIFEKHLTLDNLQFLWKKHYLRKNIPDHNSCNQSKAAWLLLEHDVANILKIPQYENTARNHEVALSKHDTFFNFFLDFISEYSTSAHFKNNF